MILSLKAPDKPYELYHIYMRAKGLKRELCHNNQLLTQSSQNYFFTINLYYLRQLFGYLNAIVFSGLQKKFSRITVWHYDPHLKPNVLTLIKGTIIVKLK